MGLIQKIFGTYSQRELKSIYPIADKIEALPAEKLGPRLGLSAEDFMQEEI